MLTREERLTAQLLFGDKLPEINHFNSGDKLRDIGANIRKDKSIGMYYFNIHNNPNLIITTLNYYEDFGVVETYSNILIINTRTNEIYLPTTLKKSSNISSFISDGFIRSTSQLHENMYNAYLELCVNGLVINGKKIG